MLMLANIFQMPMLIWEVIPMAALAVLVAVLLWDTRLPLEKRFLRKLRKQKKHHPAHGVMF